MGKKLVSRTAKVLSETKRKGGKEAIAIAYEHIPRDPEEQKHGSLYAVIELEDTGGHAEEIADRIIGILHDEYYRDTQRSPLASFESSLAKINEELADRSSEGQINWLGKLNSVLGVLSGTTLHLTQAGKAEGYLYRADHTLHITEDLSGDSINPARTFINVASGDLTEKDKIALVTPGIFYKLSKNELKKYVTEFSPKIASENISRMLTGENGANIPNAILVMEMISPEAFAVEPEPEAATETWVKDEKNMMEPVAEQTLQGTARAFEMLGKAASGASTFISTKAIPTLKVKGQKIIQGFKKEPGSERVILDSQESLTRDTDDFRNDSVLEEVNESYAREIRMTEQSRKPRLLSNLERFDFRKKTSGLGLSLKKIKLPRGRFSFVYLLIGGLLLTVVVGFAIFNSTIGKQKTASENNFKLAQSNYKDALDAIAQGNRVVAAEELKSAESLATKLKGDKYKGKEAEALLKEIITAKDQALGITRNSGQELVNLETETEALFTDGALIYALDFQKGSLFSIDPKAGTKATILTEANIEGTITAAAYIPSRKVIFALTSEGVGYDINPKTKAVTKQVASGGWENAVNVEAYLSNIYLLDPSSNQIYKHTKTSSGYGKKTPYVKNETALPGAIDLAIDSSVYVLTKSGEVQKYTAGVMEDFQIKNLPDGLAETKDIFASAEVKGIFIAGSNRIIQIDENQNFVTQYINEGVSKISGIAAVESNRTLYFQSSGKIYKISY